MKTPSVSIKQQFPYPSQRMPAMARNMVATSQPLATQAGLDALRNGGNAIDAALAAAITLTVVEPTMNGIGSDAFCILWDGSRLHGLNASGRSPASMSPERFEGMDKMPKRGWDTVTVPGAVSGWVALSERFGKLPFEKLFEAAIHYADTGFMVTPVIARKWTLAGDALCGFEDFAVFLPGGRAPRPGELFRFPDQARSLEKIASSRGETFYRGLEQLLERQLTEPFGQRHPAAYRTGNGHRIPAPFRHFIHPFEAFRRHRCRAASGCIKAMQPAPVPQNAEGVTADTVHGGFHHGQGNGGSQGGINGIATVSQCIQASLGCQWLGGCHHVPGHGRHAL